MRRMNLLIDYREILHSEQAPIRTALKIVFLAFCIGAVYIALAVNLNLKLRKAIEDTQGVKECLTKQKENNKTKEESLAKTRLILEDKQKLLSSRREAVGIQESAARLKGSTASSILAVLDQTLPRSAYLAWVGFDADSLKAEGFGLSAKAVNTLIEGLKAKGVDAHLEYLKTRRRDNRQHLYFRLSCRSETGTGRNAK